MFGYHDDSLFIVGDARSDNRSAHDEHMCKRLPLRLCLAARGENLPSQAAIGIYGQATRTSAPMRSCEKSYELLTW